MSKWYGVLGFAETAETAPGVWEDTVIERPYFGDVIRQRKRVQTGEKLTDDIQLTNDISILADPYATDHLKTLRYASYLGTLWKITDIEVQYPRLILTMGGIYNADQN